ncbi:MAG: hypothetical protein BGO25_10345 [Acidobacteriales bacterium 59-55]|nr:MAG: hypothetical protein BGO25_10345 [Acidobacteriales bacterium 59-55]
MSANTEDQHLTLGYRQMGYHVLPEISWKRHDTHVRPVENDLWKNSRFLPMSQLRYWNTMARQYGGSRQIKQELKCAHAFKAVILSTGPHRPAALTLQNTLGPMRAKRKAPPLKAVG